MSKYDFSKIDQLIDTMEQRGIPGCEFAISYKGEKIYDRCSGIANKETGKPVDEKTLWWIYSASKISTCIGAMQLVEQGKIGLEDPVSKYIPSFANLTVKTDEGPKPCDKEMKIIHLFTMTGGLDYDLQHPAALQAAFDAGKGTVDVCAEMAGKELKFAPGDHFLYSLCHDVLGAVVEVVSGMRLSEYLKKNLWEPLGMTDTGFWPTEEQKARISDTYMFDHSKGQAEFVPMEYVAFINGDKNYDAGGAGVFSCTNDYLKLMTALSLGGVSPDGVRILKEETVKMLMVNRLSDQCRKDLWTERLYGYGWGLCGRVHINKAYSLSGSSEGEFGWDGAAAAYALADPVKQVALYFGTHVLGCSYCYCWVHPKLRDLAFEAIEKAEADA